MEVTEREYTREADALVFSKDGEPIHIRPLRPTDADLLEDLFKSLSPQSIFYRFLRHWKTVPAEVIDSFKNPDCRLNVVMVALDKISSEERMLGLCGILRKPGSERGELAVVVRDEWQGIGVGAKLVEASLPAAKALGMKELWGTISLENTTTIALASKLGFTLRRDRESDSYEIEMRF
ncbi:MAG: GNAT family N-acetyltransferase [Deltaproteobacteria bacterium]|nr:GNAT family N-acetyltransferase [Deltaproteobacteria bacterium]